MDLFQEIDNRTVFVHHCSYFLWRCLTRPTDWQQQQHEEHDKTSVQDEPPPPKRYTTNLLQRIFIKRWLEAGNESGMV
jgi:HAMP domain-containing protein